MGEPESDDPPEGDDPPESDDPPRDPSRPGLPPWALALIGWLAGATGLAARGAVPPPPWPFGIDCTLEEVALPPPPPGPEEWRWVEGVGGRRALAIARALWEAGTGDLDEADLEGVVGIGPVLAGRVRAWDAARRRPGLTGEPALTGEVAPGLGRTVVTWDVHLSAPPPWDPLPSTPLPPGRGAPSPGRRP